MNSYSVFAKKNSDGKIIDAIFVKDGFAWRAFIFTGLWFLYHRMSKEFFALLAVNLVFGLGEKIFNGFSAAMLQLMLAIVVGFNAEFWLGQHLTKRGYELVRMTFGKNEEEAKLQFFCDAKLDFDHEILLEPRCSNFSRALQKLLPLKLRHL
jgi:hypothetical protein